MIGTPATEPEARKAWKRTKSLLVKKAREAFKEREIWGQTADGYHVVVSGDGEWAIGFAKNEYTVFGFDVFAYLPALPRGDENLFPGWSRN